MTDKRLNELGFVKGGWLNSIYHCGSETEFRVANIKKLKDKDLIEKFGEAMFNAGKTYGGNLKINEIKKALNISTSTD